MPLRFKRTRDLNIGYSDDSVAPIIVDVELVHPNLKVKLNTAVCGSLRTRSDRKAAVGAYDRPLGGE